MQVSKAEAWLQGICQEAAEIKQEEEAAIVIEAVSVNEALENHH